MISGLTCRHIDACEYVSNDTNAKLLRGMCCMHFRVVVSQHVGQHSPDAPVENVCFRCGRPVRQNKEQRQATTLVGQAHSVASTRDRGGLIMLIKAGIEHTVCVP